VGVVVVLVATAVGAWTFARVTADPVVVDDRGPSVLAVPVESRVLETAVVDRGTVQYAEGTVVPLFGLGGESVVTWSAGVDSRVDAGDVLVEVNGRPAFVLPGDVPMYRMLERGTAGGDVAQFQEAMIGLGLREDPPTGRFDSSDEQAAAVLYVHAGYEPNTRFVPSGVAALADRWRSLTGGVLECPDPCEGEIADIRDQLVDRYAAARVRVPPAEVVFLAGLPRRVESVPQAGSAPSFRLTAESMEAVVTMGATRATSLEVGMEAVVDVDAGAVETTGVITDISLGVGELAGVWVVSITLDEGLPELLGQTVRVRIPLVSSEGPVLAVPVSALSAGGDGSTSVTVQEPDGTTRRVPVRAGMVADGYVEVEAISGSLTVDDYVVVGQEAG
jgi:HlyD family secretion protein